jgi:hypothetical protein
MTETTSDGHIELDEFELDPNGGSPWVFVLMLNTLLGLLGVSLVTIAFLSLDAEDDRTLYNPWTYVVLTPLGLALLSKILSTVVSRLVERSLQIAFLMSVLVHLLLLTSAGNIVIFSRAWPDLFDSLSEQRKRLELQNLQARQYYEIPTEQSGSRPDHQRPVPVAVTVADSTLADPAKSNGLADSESQDLTDSQSNPIFSEPPVPRESVAKALGRLATPSEADIPIMQPDVLKEAIPRSQVARQSLGWNYLSKIESPAPAADSTETSSASELSPAILSSELERPANRLAAESLSALSNPSDIAVPGESPPGPRTALTDRMSISKLEASNDLMRVLSDGSDRETIPRSTAGGRPGSVASLSLPRLGKPSLEESNDRVQPNASLPSRIRPGSTLPEYVPDSGVTQSQEKEARSMRWEGVARTSIGRISKARGRNQNSSLDGDALASDLAGLTGSQTDVERSALGAMTPAEASAPPESLSNQSVDRPSESLTEDRGAALSGQSIPVGEVAAIRRRSTAQGDSLEYLGAAAVRTRSDLNSGMDLGSESELDPSAATSGSSPTKAWNLPVPSRSQTMMGSQNRLEEQLVRSSSLSRSRLGGRTRPAISGGVAKPAFQQRLDRLRDDSSDESQAAAGTASQSPVDLAIERGLEFLAKHQRNDGSWRLQDFDTEVLIRSDTAATGLSLLAFQGAGYTHLNSKYSRQLERAIGFLLKHQTTEGDLYIPQDPASDQNAWLYSHSIAALALCEAYGMTQDQRLRLAAQRAIDFMVDSQDRSRGGWRYRPGSGSDTSVTGWFMMALKSGQLAGLSIPDETLRGIMQYVEDAQASPTASHLYRYNPFAPDSAEQRHGLRPTAAMTSVGLLMRLYLGWNREKPEMIRGADFLLEHPPQLGTRGQSLRDTYYWYYATQVVFHVGGDQWQRWQANLYPMLIEHQISTGEFAGSWSPDQPVPDLWSRYGGRLYVTTMNLLSLEVSYRHLPLYDATVAE